MWGFWWFKCQKCVETETIVANLGVKYLPAHLDKLLDSGWTGQKKLFRYYILVMREAHFAGVCQVVANKIALHFGEVLSGKLFHTLKL